MAHFLYKKSSSHQMGNVQVDLGEGKSGAK